MFKVDRNDKAFKELNDYATSIGKPLKEVLLSDEHLDKVAGIFYSHMPKMVRWSMKEPKFKEFYKEHRETFVNHLTV